MSAGKIIKFLRVQNGLTQEELAQILNVKKSSVQKYEANDVPNLKIDTIRQLSTHFGVTANAFIFPERYRDIDLTILLKLDKDLKTHHDRLLCNLNEKGRNKVFEYTKDLVDSGNYAR